MAPSEVFAQCQIIILHDDHLLKSRAIEVGVVALINASDANLGLSYNRQSRIVGERQRFLLLET